MNQLYIQSVIDDREREVGKAMEINRFHRHNRGFVTSQPDAAEKGKNILSSWIWMIANRLVGVFQVDDKSNAKV